MKKKIAMLLMCILLMVSLTACDTTKDEEKIINIVNETHYINTTESWSVMSHNGYKGYYVDKTYDEENDEYTVVIKFKKY